MSVPKRFPPKEKTKEEITEMLRSDLIEAWRSTIEVLPAGKAKRYGVDERGEKLIGTKSINLRL